MSGQIVPELHDIGKLAPSGFKHTFDEFDFERQGIRPDSPTWRGILEHHHGDQDKLYPSSRQTFLLAVADGLAATCSRLPPGSKSMGRGVAKVWNPDNVSTLPGVNAEELVRFVESDPSANEFFRRFRGELTQRAEDVRANVTSLRTHCELVGKFYRLLEKRYASSVPDPSSKTKEQVCSDINSFKSQNRFTLIRCSPHFSISPFRARDLGVFVRQRRIFQDVKTRFPDNVLFSTAQHLLLAIEDPDVWTQISSAFRSSGFWAEVASASLLFSQLGRDMDLLEALGPRTTRSAEFPAMQREIKPPLCEGCRLNGATMKWREGDREDELCEICYGIREEGASLERLADWTERVVWMRISLDFDGLVQTLHKLYAQKLERAGVSGKAEVRFSLVAEFQQDYDAFLGQVADGVRACFDASRVETPLPELSCVRINKESEILDLLRVYHHSIGRLFPAFGTTGSSPLRVGISCSAARFPFFEHWRFLDSLTEDVSVHLVGRGRLRASLRALPEILSIASMPSRSALHKLAEVAKISEQLARLKMHDKVDQDQSAYRQLRERLMPYGLDYRSLLGLATILGE